MKYAWIENGKVRDVAHDEPSTIYHEDIAAFYNTEVPDNTENGDGWVDGQLIKQTPPAPPAPVPRQWLDVDFRSGMTLAEKVKWDNDSAPEIVTVKAELPKPLAGATELANFLVEAGVISQASADKILA